MVVWDVLRRCATASTEERCAFFQAYVELGLVRFSLRRYGLQRYLEAIEESANDPTTIGRPNYGLAHFYAGWIARAARGHVLPATCLQRSLVLHNWLRRAGQPSVLRIGVRKSGDRLAAHAWVELAGQPVNDLTTALVPFTPLRSTRDLSLGDQAIPWTENAA